MKRKYFLFFFFVMMVILLIFISGILVYVEGKKYIIGMDLIFVFFEF